MKHGDTEDTEVFVVWLFLVVATHKYEVARHWADFVVVMDQGNLLAAGYTEEIFE